MNATYTMQDLMRYRHEQMPFLSALERGFGNVRIDPQDGALIVNADGRDYKIAFQRMETTEEKLMRLRFEEMQKQVMAMTVTNVFPPVFPREGS